MHEGTYGPQLMVEHRERSLNNNSSITTTRLIKCRHQLSRLTGPREVSAVAVRDRNTCRSFKTWFNKLFPVISRKVCFFKSPPCPTLNTTVPMSLSYSYGEVRAEFKQLLVDLLKTKHGVKLNIFKVLNCLSDKIRHLKTLKWKICSKYFGLNLLLFESEPRWVFFTFQKIIFLHFSGRLDTQTAAKHSWSVSLISWLAARRSAGV